MLLLNITAAKIVRGSVIASQTNRGTPRFKSYVLHNHDYLFAATRGSVVRCL